MYTKLVLIILFRCLSVVLVGCQSNQDNRRNILRISCSSCWFLFSRLRTLCFVVAVEYLIHNATGYLIDIIFKLGGAHCFRP
jgi:hypothetical protein